MSVRKTKKNGKPILLIDFRYTDPTGTPRRFRKVADVQTMAAAKAEEQRLRMHAAETGEPYSVSGSKCPTFAEFIAGQWQNWTRTHHKPSTRERYQALLDQGVLSAFGAYQLDEIDAAAVTEYAAYLTADNVQAWPHVSFVSSVLRAAVALGVLAEMPRLPPSRRKKRKLPSCPDHDEIVTMLSFARSWVRLAIALAAYAGLRSGEVRALEVADIDLKHGIILVRRSLSADQVTTTKGDEERVVPIAPELDILLRASIKGKRAKDRIVVMRDGSTPSRQKIWSRVDRLQQRHGLRHRSFHSIRHFFCTSLLQRGADIELVRTVAGHQDIETTWQYLHSNNEDARVVMSRPYTGPVLVSGSK